VIFSKNFVNICAWAFGLVINSLTLLGLSDNTVPLVVSGFVLLSSIVIPLFSGLTVSAIRDSSPFKLNGGFIRDGIFELTLFNFNKKLAILIGPIFRLYNNGGIINNSDGGVKIAGIISGSADATNPRDETFNGIFINLPVLFSLSHKNNVITTSSSVTIAEILASPLDGVVVGFNEMKDEPDCLFDCSGDCSCDGSVNWFDNGVPELLEALITRPTNLWAPVDLSAE